MSRKTIFIVVGLLLMAALALAACQQATPETIETIKTVIVTQEVVTEGETVILEVVVTATPEPVETGPRTLVICMGQEPETLYPYGGSMLAMSSVLEAIYDGPIDARTYDYQAVILEKLPSLADGDATLVPVTVKAGDRIVGDDGEVHVLEADVLYRPAGCNAADCAVAYDGTSDVEMDQLSATFKLLPGLMWTDGTPLTAADSVYSFNLAADPDTPTVKSTLERTASYEATDDVTVVWTGLPGYKDATYFVNFWTPYPEHVWGQYTAAELVSAVDADALHVGWGPYILDEWVKGDRINMSKNPDYFRASEGLPYFENLVYRFVGADSNANIAAILSGECDIVDQTSSLDDQSELLLSLQAAGQLQASFVTGTTFEHADFNIFPAEGSGFAGLDTDGDGLGPFADVRLRQAVAMCMDRQAVVDTVLFGQSIVLDTYIPPEHPLFNPEVKHWDFDVAAASALLDEIGWLDDDGDPATPRVATGVTGVPDGTLLEFFYETTNATMRMQATQVMADSMAQCGFKVNLNYYPASEWFADGPDGKLFGRRTDLGQFAWLTGVQPACDLWTTNNIPGPEDETNPFTGNLFNYGWGGQNQTGYSNPEYDVICNSAVQALPGQPAYEENHLAAQAIFAEELPVVPLFLRLKLAATRIDMCNFIMDPTANSEMWNIEAFNYGEACGQ
jgi:peptide/nickel transport system substrate-binding protein